MSANVTRSRLVVGEWVQVDANYEEGYDLLVGLVIDDLGDEVRHQLDNKSHQSVSVLLQFKDGQWESSSFLAGDLRPIPPGGKEIGAFARALEKALKVGPHAL